MPPIESSNSDATTGPGNSRWKKGASGNPAGRPPGSRNKSTQILEQLLEGEAESLVRKAIELALKGDTVALRLCMDRLSPPRKERLIEFPLPDLSDAQNAPAATAAILGAAAKGQITPGEAESLARTVQIHNSIIETRELARRITELENLMPEILPKIETETPNTTWSDKPDVSESGGNPLRPDTPDFVDSTRADDDPSASAPPSTDQNPSALPLDPPAIPVEASECESQSQNGPKSPQDENRESTSSASSWN